MNAPLHRSLASSVETDELQAHLAAGRATSAAMDDVFVKIAMLWLAASVRNFRWARERGYDPEPYIAAMCASHDQYEAALKAAEDRGQKPARALPDALANLGNAVHARGAKAFRDSRLPYPKDEEEIARG